MPFADFWFAVLREQYLTVNEGFKNLETREELEAQRRRFSEASFPVLHNDVEFCKILESTRESIRMNANTDMNEMRSTKKSEMNRLPRYKPVSTKSAGMKEKVVCCPECLTIDVGNTTDRLNRKQRRNKINKIIHPTAFCIKCAKRMVYMSRENRMNVIMRQTDEKTRLSHS